ncbi:MAG: LytTR family transcriptional regulator DNA-binding domain-containing protein [Bacteroidales bacterium]|nr:LytTR family transcriptional regulator DNA-binding domain-containing protein [Bacteroidales bacterium]MCF8402420.1 LytTR family transcriptional regulator DNA-binding domain-containing protein [Bacteroidales bacterium]
MLKSLNKPYPFYDDLIYNLKVIFGISLGVFLFFLFFQPIELRSFEFNNRLLIITGFGGISLIILGFWLIIIPSIFTRIFLSGNWKIYKDLTLNLIIWAMLAVAFHFYARYVGLVSITFDVSFRIILLSLIPVAILIVIHQFNYLKKHVQQLIDLTRQAGIPLKNEGQDRNITFQSDNKKENFNLKLSDLVFIKSANNYIEIFFQDKNQLQKKLIRATLKDTEDQLAKFRNIVRCHRTTLINTIHILKFGGQPGSLILKLKNFEEEVLVSRQYLEKVKEALK